MSKQHQDELQKLKSTVDRLERELQKFSQLDNYGRPRQGNQYRQGDQPRQGNQNNERRCFECGSKFHIMMQCPSLKNRRPIRRDFKKETNDEKEDRSAANTVGPGLYIHVDLNGQILNCLVDTGASLSMLSTRVWENSNLSKNRVLPSYNKTNITASGSALDVIGKTSISLKIGKRNYDTEVIVADIENDMLLGLDFMKNHDCTVDVGRNALIIKGKSFDMNCMGKIGCHRFIAKYDEKIPAMSENIISGKVLDMEGGSNDLNYSRTG